MTRKVIGNALLAAAVILLGLGLSTNQNYGYQAAAVLCSIVGFLVRGEAGRLSRQGNGDSVRKHLKGN